jgi:hypothetical protein
MLVVVGPTWMERLRPGGCGSSGEVDWVRIEIATALNGGTRVIPVLLSQTPRLVECQLPADIAALAHKQYVKFEHRNVERDFAQLVAALDSAGWSSRVDAYSVDRGHGLSGSSGQKDREFAINWEVGADGNVELDIVSRDGQGAIAGRLSGRASPADLPRLVAMITRSLDPVEHRDHGAPGAAVGQVALTMNSKDCSAAGLTAACVQWATPASRPASQN